MIPRSMDGPVDALRISQGKLHAICGEIRAMRRDDAESANFPPMVLAEYEEWMEYGELPKRLAGVASPGLC